MKPLVYLKNVKDWITVLTYIYPLFKYKLHNKFKHRTYFRSLFVLLYFFLWPLSCLFFFDLWILITTLVSSNSSYDQRGITVEKISEIFKISYSMKPLNHTFLYMKSHLTGTLLRVLIGQSKMAAIVRRT